MDELRESPGFESAPELAFPSPVRQAIDTEQLERLIVVKQQLERAAELLQTIQRLAEKSPEDRDRFARQLHFDDFAHYVVHCKNLFDDVRHSLESYSTSHGEESNMYRQAQQALSELEALETSLELELVGAN